MVSLSFALSNLISNSIFTAFVTSYLSVCVSCDFFDDLWVVTFVWVSVPFLFLRLYLLVELFFFFFFDKLFTTTELVVKFWSSFIWLVNSASKLQWVWVCGRNNFLINKVVWLGHRSFFFVFLFNWIINCKWHKNSLCYENK